MKRDVRQMDPTTTENETGTKKPPVDETWLDVLRTQEEKLRYRNAFGAREALELGNEVASLANDYDRGLCVRIVREEDDFELFGWGADDKAPRNYGFMEGKRIAAKETGHSSLWPWAKHQVDGSYEGICSNEGPAIAAGGAFPIRVGDKWVATILASGLHDGQDHEVIVRALSNVLDIPVPEYLAESV